LRFITFIPTSTPHSVPAIHCSTCAGVNPYIAI
jgi:hypothetical protein